MRMDASLHLRQEMRMRLAPQIIQSIEILQLPLIELRQRVDQELTENPMLERLESPEEAEAPASESPPASEVEAPKEEKVDEVTVEESNEDIQYERLAELTRYCDDFSGEDRPRANASDERDPKMEAFENSPAPDPSLKDHLNHQLTYLDVDETTREICENIVANLDARGYLPCALEEVIASLDFEVAPEQAGEALAVVQSLEPPGVGARSLEECLLLQLDQREADYDLLSRLINEHFEDILKNRYPQVARALGCTIEDLKAAVEKISKLNPVPGSLFENPEAPHVVPDLRLEEVDGEYVIILEDSWLPPLRISSYYARRLQRKDLDPKTREYLQKKLQSAQGLISAIQQRRTTVFRVATEIMKVQRAFLEQGDMHLTPLKMQDIADEVGVHVSTVSRAISDKYIQTPHGVYSLKHFFTGGLEKQDGEVESWEVVRQKLQHIIDNEDKSKPLNDEEIAEALRKQGIDIARRTVTKYRKTLNIPSSRMRKEY